MFERVRPCSRQSCDDDMNSSILRFPGKRSDRRILGKMGSLETRLAVSRSEIKQAQRLRYEVFYNEQSAKAGIINRKRRRDKDRFDAFCDHLVVVDRDLPEDRQVVGTYRLLDDESAKAAGGFYSQNEFDLTRMLAQTSHCHLELGRSCIARPYRSRRTMELMWQGIWAIAVERQIDVLFGCVSFQGCDVEDHMASLNWLTTNAKLDEHNDCAAIHNAVDIGPADDFSELSARRVFSNLPPLLKGYLRVGAKVSSTASIDHQFNTVDLLVVLRIADIAPKYIQHYGADASRFAA